MPADEEGHVAAGVVLHGEAGFKAVRAQAVGHAQGEVEGIEAFGFGGFAEGEGDEVLALLGDAHGQLPREAVARHGIDVYKRQAQCAYVVLAGAVILCILFMAAITPQRYDQKVGDISDTTITATKDVVDEISTCLLYTSRCV